MRITIKSISENLPIISNLRSYNLQNYVKFHMPGHQDLKITKHHTKIQKKVINILRDYQNKLFSYDLTEVENLDNLQDPSSCIKESQDIISTDYSVKKTFFLTQGSTLGVMSMIILTCGKKGKIILPEKSHKSAYQAMNLFDIKPAFIYQEKSEIFSSNEKIDIKSLEKTVQKNKDAKAIFVTSPDYYGIVQDIEKIAKIAHENNMYLIVDYAHGAHFHYLNEKIMSPIELGADIQVTSFHKTLPALTSTAILQVSNNMDDDFISRLKDTVNTLQTSSPSYILLSSIELTHFIMKTYGKNLYKSLVGKIIAFKNHMKNHPGINILETDDITRIVINIENIDGEELSNLLRKKYKILAEMNNDKSIVLITNPFNTKMDFNRLEKAIIDINARKEKLKKFIKNDQNLQNNKIFDYLKKNIGKKSEKTFYIYPPGTPLIKKDDIITEDIINLVKKFQNSNVKIFS